MDDGCTDEGLEVELESDDGQRAAAGMESYNKQIKEQPRMQPEVFKNKYNKYFFQEEKQSCPNSLKRLSINVLSPKIY